MSDLIHNFAARKRKRDASFERAVNAIPGVAKGSSQSRSDEGSGGGEAIVISSSPEMGLNDQSASEEVALAESREAFLALVVIQVVHPPKKDVGHSDKTKYTQAGRRRLLLPDWMLLNSYLPHCGPAPPRKRYQFLGWKALRRLSIGGGPSVGANLRLTICMSYT